MKYIILIIGLLLPIITVAEQKWTITLTKENTLVLNNEVNADSVSVLIEQARQLDSELPKGAPIALFLNTPGGSIQDGLELIEALKALNRPVSTITLFAASMGWQIAQNLGNRYILSNGILMSHQARGGFQGSFGDGLSQLDSRYAIWMERVLELDKITVARTKGKQTLASYREQYKNEMWLTGAQAVKMGYADKVVTVRCSASLNGTHKTNVQFMGQVFVVDYSNCPINTNPLTVDIQVSTNKGFMGFKEMLSKGGEVKAEGSFNSADLYTTEKLTISEVNAKIEAFKRNLNDRMRNVTKSY